MKTHKGEIDMNYVARVNKTAFLVIYFNDQIALPPGTEF